MSDWKPGTVAMLRGRGGGEEVGYFDGATWLYTWGSSVDAADIPGSLVDKIRPLVVIDPEDREQTDRLSDALAAVMLSPGRDYVQAALRELANPTPPRIDEPARWGVVEASCVHTDTRYHWMRHEDDNWWPFAKYNDGDQKRPLPDDWDSLIDPVLVREGVAS